MHTLLMVAVGLLAAPPSEATSEDDVKADIGRCNAGESEACGRLAIDFERGYGATRDVARAAEYSELAHWKTAKPTPPCPRCERCARHELEAAECEGLCQHLDGDVRVCPVAALQALENNPDRARVLADRGCRAGVASSCTLMAHMLDVAPDAKPADKRQAEALRQRACDGGEVIACGELAVSGASVKGRRLEQRVLRLLGKACVLDYLAACDALADAYLKGNGVPKDESLAVDHYRHACEGRPGAAGKPESCLSLAEIYARSDSNLNDPKRARAYFNRACDAGMSEACTRAVALGAP